MRLDPLKLEDNCLYSLATVPGDNNAYEGVQFVDGVARMIPGAYARRLVGKLNPLHVFENDDELEWNDCQPSLRKAVAVKLELPKELAFEEEPKKKRGRPKKK